MSTVLETTQPQTLPEDFVTAYKDRQVPWSNELGYVTYKRTYARPVVPASLGHIEGYYNQLKAYRERLNDPHAFFRTEEWWETTARCVNWYLQTARGAVSVEEGMELFDDVFNLRCSFAGRGLWQYGTATVQTIGSASLCNCYFVNVDSLDSFLFAFDMLMLGGGVGFSVQKEYVYELPRVNTSQVTRKDTNDADFIVPDCREGWIELLARVFDAYFNNGKEFSYSTKCIRPYGAPIAGFGGVASGPEPLCDGITQICDVLNSRVGKKLRPVDAMDIMNIIGSIVVAGNVRRSAELCLGDHEDTAFLLAKRFDLSTPVPNWRSMSNNTVVCNDIEHLNDKFWKTYEVGGEPYGLFNLKLSQNKGRLKDKHRKDKGVSGTNPCAEISLASGESCNLAEIFLPRMDSADQFAAVAKRIWKVCKVVTCVPHHWDFADAIISKNRRTGLGVTGVVEVLQGWTDATLQEALDQTYEMLERTDEEFSAELSHAYGTKIPTSVKLTTVKPSGTLSLLGGCAPGVHPAYAPYYIRRVRVASDSPVVTACREAGLPVEAVLRFDGSKDPKTSVVEFPVQVNAGAIMAKDMTAIDQLEIVKMMQTYWSDNAVSCTVYYKSDELDTIKTWLAENYNDGIKSVSFLLHSEHGFAQAPYEEIDEKEYQRRAKNLKPVDLSNAHEEDYDSLDSGCAGGACPVR